VSSDAETLRPLYLFDIVFRRERPTFGKRSTSGSRRLDHGRCPRGGGSRRARRDEFSTYDWIMEGILTRSGFDIDAANTARVFSGVRVHQDMSRNVHHKRTKGTRGPVLQSAETPGGRNSRFVQPEVAIARDNSVVREDHATIGMSHSCGSLQRAPSTQEPKL